MQLTLKLSRARQRAADNGAGIVGELDPRNSAIGQLRSINGLVFKGSAGDGASAENNLVVGDAAVSDQGDRIFQQVCDRNLFRFIGADICNGQQVTRRKINTSECV